MKELSDSGASFFVECMKMINTAFQDCPDLVRRQIAFTPSDSATFLYLKAIVDEDSLQRNFIAPISLRMTAYLSDPQSVQNIPSAELKTTKDLQEMEQELLHGSALFLSESFAYAVIYSAPKNMERAIEEPATEKSIKGAHDGFIESLETNVGILRKKIINSKLKFRQLKMGTVSNLSVCVAYLDGVADQQMLDDLMLKLSNIKMDNVPAVGYIAKAISSSPNSPFEQMQITERPDKAVSALIEGRFVVMLDGIPNVLIAPITFFSFFETMDDYGRSWFLGAFLRSIRLCAMLITIFLPSMYLAFTGFHYYMIPITLITTLAQSRSRVPFPPFLEILVLEFAIEVLREATIRLPTYIGMTIGVVGGIVIGQAAVDAGIISNLLLIVVGFTAICASTLPNYDHALGVRFTRFLCLLCTAFFGIIGMEVFAMLFFAHLVSLDSLGQPYLKPQNLFRISSK